MIVLDFIEAYLKDSRLIVPFKNKKFLMQNGNQTDGFDETVRLCCQTPPLLTFSGMLFNLRNLRAQGAVRSQHVLHRTYNLETPAPSLPEMTKLYWLGGLPSQNS